MRQYSLFDQIIMGFDKLLKPCGTWIPASAGMTEENNKKSFPSEMKDNLSSIEKKQSVSLMRVNHSGEVCAQALYEGQAFVASDPKLGMQLKEAAKEEQDHLHWCATRIEELGGRPSFLNPLWGFGSFCIGMLAGSMGDKISLGFLAETEFQVTAHLDKHLRLLPKQDEKSREILLKMREDELRHATNAIAHGGESLPYPIKVLMQATSKVMTITAKYI